MSQTSNTTQTTQSAQSLDSAQSCDSAQSLDGAQSGTTVAELETLVGELLERVRVLEKQAEQRHPEVSEDVVLAIAAACAAYLGQRAVVKQVHLRRGSGWASQGRAAAQQSHAELHGYGDRQAPLTQIPRRATT